ncbi:MAG: YggT family protein [Treponema sp.]|nr:YggT family protein [Treponema sp.]
MVQFAGFLGTLVSVYMMIVFFRIILTWFSWMRRGRLHDFLARLTDPYLNWFRRFTFLRVGFLDLSPVAGLAVLALANRVLVNLAHHQTISAGIVLAMALQMVWGVVSFLLGLLIVVFALRLVAYFARANMYNPLWRAVDAIFQFASFKINRLLFKGRIVNFANSIIISIAVLGLLFLGLRFLVMFASGVLAGLPI